jgi:hypothetical protein
MIHPIVASSRYYVLVVGLRKSTASYAGVQLDLLRALDADGVRKPSSSCNPNSFVLQKRISARSVRSPTVGVQDAWEL